MSLAIKQNSALSSIKNKMSNLTEQRDDLLNLVEGYKREIQNKDTKCGELEAEVTALNRRLQIIEEKMETTEERLADATAKLEQASAAADESERCRRYLENRAAIEDDKVEQLGFKNKEIIEQKDLSDRQSEETARRNAVLEDELGKAESRLLSVEENYKKIHEEMHHLTCNYKSLQISEDKAQQREEAYEDSIRDYIKRLKDVEERNEALTLRFLYDRLIEICVHDTS